MNITQEQILALKEILKESLEIPPTYAYIFTLSMADRKKLHDALTFQDKLARNNELD